MLDLTKLLLPMMTILNIYCNHNHDALPLMPWDAISCHISHPWTSSAYSGLWLVRCGCSPGRRHFSHLHIHQMAHEYWWAGCRHSRCPVAAGHCGKLAASLIVIGRPSCVSIKIRKDDTFGGTCSSEYVCMRRRGEIEGERKSKCVCAYNQDHKTAPLPW